MFAELLKNDVQQKRDATKRADEEKSVTVSNERILNETAMSLLNACDSARQLGIEPHVCGFTAKMCLEILAGRSHLARAIGKSVPLANFLSLIRRIDLSMNSKSTFIVVIVEYMLSSSKSFHREFKMSRERAQS